MYQTAAVLLFCIGLHGVFVRRHMLKQIIAVNIMGAGTFLFFISVAKRNAGAFVDPVPQAMVLTGIVVALSASALALALASKLNLDSGKTTLDPEEEEDSDSFDS